MKPKPMPEVNWRNFDDVVIPTEKREEVLNKLRSVL